MIVAPINSSAVENGVLLDGDENAVYLLDGSVNAFLYKPQIAFTSAHGTAEWGKGELFVNTSSGKKVKLERTQLTKFGSSTNLKLTRLYDSVVCKTLHQHRLNSPPWPLPPSPCLAFCRMPTSGTPQTRTMPL
mgnify:CR=1 FL=1